MYYVYIGGRRETYVVPKADKDGTDKDGARALDETDVPGKNHVHFPAIPLSLLPLDEEGLDEDGFRFSVSKLPPWAQKTVYSRPSIAATVGVDTKKGGGGVTIATDGAAVTGRWAEVCLLLLLLLLLLLIIRGLLLNSSL